MLTKLETMENQAKFIGSSVYKFTPYDDIKVVWYEGWGNDYWFRYFFNGVEYEREYIEEKIPFNWDGFEDGFIPGNERGFE